MSALPRLSEKSPAADDDTVLTSQVLLIVQAVAIYHPSRVLPLPWSERQHKHEKHGLVTLA